MKIPRRHFSIWQLVLSHCRRIADRKGTSLSDAASPDDRRIWPGWGSNHDDTF